MASKTVWHLTMSLDGFIADREGKIAWMSAATMPAPMGAALVPSIGAILTGRGTHDADQDADQPGDAGPYGGRYDGPVFVLTHEPPSESLGVTFLSDGLPSALATARDAAGRRTLVIFGARLGQECLEHGELDELLIHIAPVFIGAGAPVYRSDDGRVRTFDVLEQSSPGEVTTLRLRPVREAADEIDGRDVQ